MGGFRKIVPAFVRRRYSVKFGIALLLLAVLVATIGVVGTAQIEQEVRDGTNEEYSSIAQQEARNLEAWNKRNLLLAPNIARSGVVQQGRTPGIQTALQGWKQELPPDTQTLYYVNYTTDSIEASSTPDHQGQSLSTIDAPWTDRSAVYSGSGQFVSDPFTRTIQGESVPLIAYAVPVPNQPGNAVVVTMRLDRYVTENLQTNEYSGSTFVVDRTNGTILLDEYDSQYLQQYQGTPLETARSADEPGTVQLATPGDTLRQSSGIGTDEEYLVGYASVEGTDWVVLVHVEKAEAYGFVNTVSQYGLLATFGGVLVIGLVGTVLGRNTARSIDRLTAKTEAMESGDLDVTFETERIDNIGRLYDGFGNMRDALETKITEVEEARAETEAMNERLERKAAEYSSVMQECARGDFTRRMDPECENEAMAQIAVEFNEMIAEIEATTERLNDFADEVAAASEEVTASSEEVRSASEQVTESIQEISDGAERQNDRFQNVSQEMDSLSTTTEEIAASSNEVADIAERTAETGREGREAARDAIEGMAEIEAETGQAVDAIDDLEAEMAQIDELLDVITEVAEETNMLALNANIEASRSGESGEGFSVVASQVKELAAETKDAANDIEDRLDSIHSQTETTASEVQSAAERVSEHTDSVREAARSLEEIAGYAQETNTGVQEISAATEQQAASTQEVVAIVDEAATISEETTAEAENVAAAAEQQTTALTEVSRSANDLARQASHLSDALDRFDTDADSGDVEGLLADPDDREFSDEEIDARTESAVEPVPSQDSDGPGADSGPVESPTREDDGPEDGADAFQFGGGESEVDGSDPDDLNFVIPDFDTADDSEE